MTLFFLIFLFVFWVVFGSFSSVVIYRLRSGESWLFTGRSHCPKCSNTLQTQHLIPIFSYIFQWGKCAFCKEKIPMTYPLLELTGGIIFMALGYFLIDPYLIAYWNLLEISRLIFFLGLWFLTLVYVWYDILFLEIPESILLIANIWVFFALILQWYGYKIFPHLPVWGLSYDIILLTFVVLLILYMIFLMGLREIYDVAMVTLAILMIWGYMYIFDIHHTSSALLSWTIAALAIYISFFLQILFSWGRAMGAWDLRIAILMGLIVWVSFAFAWWMICYIIGSIIWLGFMLYQKVIKKSEEISHQIPFGPFIATGYIWVLLFSYEIWELIKLYFRQM